MTIAQTVNTPRTSAQRAAVEELQLANNGVTHAQSVSRANALYPTYRKGTPRVFVSHELSAE